MLDKILAHSAQLLFRREVADKELDNAGIALLRAAGAEADVPRRAAFYFYFAHRESADRVAGRLHAQSFSVIVDRAALGTDWLVLASKEMLTQDGSIESLRPAFEALAKAEGGEYDGWEVEMAEPA